MHPTNPSPQLKFRSRKLPLPLQNPRKIRDNPSGTRTPQIKRGSSKCKPRKRKSKGISKSKIFHFKVEWNSTRKPTQKVLAANTATAIKKQEHVLEHNSVRIKKNGNKKPPKLKTTGERVEM